LAQIEWQAIGINVLCELPTVVFFPGWLNANNATASQSLVVCVDVIYAEAEMALPSRVFIGGVTDQGWRVGSMQSQRSSRRIKLSPLGRFESKWKPQDISVKLNRALHVVNEHNAISKLEHGFFLRLAIQRAFLFRARVFKSNDKWQLPKHPEASYKGCRNGASRTGESGQSVGVVIQ